MKSSKDSIRCFKFFGKFAWKNGKGYYLLLMANIIINSIYPFISIIGSQYLIDEIADTSRRNIGWVAFWIAFICGGNFIFSNIRKYIGENISRICEKFDRILKTDLCMSCINMKFKNTEDTEVLDIIKNAERALNETGQVNGLITSLSNIITNFIVAIGVVTLVCTKIPWLMIPVIISFAANSYTTSKVNKSRRKFFDEMGNVERGSTYFNTELQESRYAKDVRLYDASGLFEKKYDGYVDRLYGTSKKYHTRFTKYWNISDVCDVICDSSIYILLAVNVFHKVISIGEFSSLFQATSKFGGAIRGIVNSYLEMNYTSSVLKYYIDFVEDIYGSSERLMDLRDSGDEVTDQACEIEFKNVSFKYPNTDKYILKNTSVKIKAGERLAIVGQNGAGKTTFIKLLCHLYDNYEGEILINGKEAREYNFVEYVKRLSVVFQDFRLFAFTVKENVTVFEDKNIDMEEIYKIAGIDQWIESLNEKDQTYIYKMFMENGIEPSGGESQKLAIARALYKNAPIVVLDEPTAALDPISEYEVYKNFDKLVHGKTAIYISHRLSSCRFCDRIIVFHNGSIEEEGSHEELMKNTNGLYYHMYSTQAKHYK
ncbi:ABC transporter ATP-binding protein [Eubacterium ventriosum]|jgi:ATP-binding cassette subfamily B protein|uniref:ABC transporter ATP-binding protein n=1 Tax=Eubacterium ventriosum TaxID=39496 RepID=UPI0035225FE9